ncbi:MAG: hypothetical protein FWC94_05225 [Bacteroidales bacterium]|nr:hypothetical protein [Bacteroidales bacterium]
MDLPIWTCQLIPDTKKRVKMNNHFKILFFALTIMAVGYDAFGRVVKPSYANDSKAFSPNLMTLCPR